MGKRKPKVLTPEQAGAIRAKDFFDCILPGTIKFQADYYIIGDSYRCTWVIKEYPPSMKTINSSPERWQKRSKLCVSGIRSA